MTSTAFAAAALQGNTLFVQYSTSRSAYGSLFTLTPAAPSSTPPSPPEGAPLPPIPPPLTPPLNMDLFSIQRQVLDFGSTVPPFISLRGKQQVNSASLISTSPQGQQELFLALNMQLPDPQSNLAPIQLQIAFLYHLVPSKSSAGPPSWSASDFTGAFRLEDVKRLWLAGGPDSRMYELRHFVYPSPPTSFDSNVWERELVVNIAAPAAPNFFLMPDHIAIDSEAKIVRLSDSTPFRTVTVGVCAASQQGTCLVFLGKNTYAEMITPLKYDPLSCISASGTNVIMVTQSQVYTLNFGSLTPTTLMSATWTVQQQTKVMPLPGPVLACAASETTFHAILQGPGQRNTPLLMTIDLTSGNWDWKTPQVTSSDGSDPGSGGSGGGGVFPPIGEGQPTSGSNSSNSATIGVAVAAVVLVVGAVAVWFFYRRRRNRRNFQAGEGPVVEKVVPRSAPGYSPVHTESPLSGPGMPVFVPVHSAAPGSFVVTTPPGVGPSYQEYGSQHTSRSWSSGTFPEMQPQQQRQSYVPTSTATPPLHFSPPMEQAPMVATTLAHAPYQPFVVSPASPLQRPGSAAGAKQELTSEDIIEPSFASVSASSSAAPAVASSSSDAGFLQPSNTEGSTGKGTRKPRIQDIMSPGLANAQLILQHSQQPAQQHQRMSHPGGDYRP